MIDRLIEKRRPTGDELARVLAALANPHRLRIVATLAARSVHVSQLARDVGLSRPLVHMHLQRLEAAGLVTGRLELSEDGKAMKFFEVTPFAIDLTPELVVEAARTLTLDRDATALPDRKETP
jgi:DNA-binding transcriptional ArsR family regulator